MAEKRFSTVSGTVATAEINADYENAGIYDKLRVGTLGVYFRDGFRMKYIPYDYIDRAFIRVQQAHAAKCCGEAIYDYFRMVFVHGGKEFADCLSENERAMDAALAKIAAHGVVTGFIRAEASA